MGEALRKRHLGKPAFLRRPPRPGRARGRKAECRCSGKWGWWRHQPPFSYPLHCGLNLTANHEPVSADEALADAASAPKLSVDASSKTKRLRQIGWRTPLGHQGGTRDCKKLGDLVEKAAPEMRLSLLRQR
jgi:hypothetical protein